ncbi:GNAT family N-acetyltransferase [Pluralibacter gergoviae]|uniref:GNAT family N-acetyltransferase n=1 Tax=Enterobacteriaceae TaxID=543 RepID=UPI00333E58D2
MVCTKNRLSVGYFPFSKRTPGRTLCDYAIKQLGINSVFACHLERNPASGRVLNKIGFKFIGQESKFISNHNKKEIVFNYLLGVEFLVRDCFIQE